MASRLARGGAVGRPLRVLIAAGCWAAVLLFSYVSYTVAEFAWAVALAAALVGAALTAGIIYAVISPWTFVRVLAFTVGLYVVGVVLMSASLVPAVIARANYTVLSTGQEVVRLAAFLAASSLFIVGVRYIAATVGIQVIESGKRHGVDRSEDTALLLGPFLREFRLTTGQGNVNGRVEVPGFGQVKVPGLCGGSRSARGGSGSALGLSHAV